MLFGHDFTRHQVRNGPRDALHTMQAARAECPDAQLVVLPDVGHLAHYEAPAAVAARIVEYL